MTTFFSLIGKGLRLVDAVFGLLHQADDLGYFFFFFHHVPPGNAALRREFDDIHDFLLGDAGVLQQVIDRQQ
jgi:hypothetical protein